MLARTHRIVRPQDFSRIYRSGKRFGNTFLVLHHLPTSSVSRVGIVISTKVSKKSTRRNRIKRILREEMQKNLSRLSTGDYVIVVRPAMRDEESQDIRDLLAKVFAKFHNHS